MDEQDWFVPITIILDRINRRQNICGFDDLNIADIADAIESGDLLKIDRFGRLKQANSDDKDDVLEILADYHTLRNIVPKSVAIAAGEAARNDDDDLFKKIVSENFETQKRETNIPSGCQYYGWMYSRLSDVLAKNSKNKNETPQQRNARIKKYVNDAFAAGRSKKSAYAELAKSEGCTPGNIIRIYGDKDKKKTKY